MTDLAAIVVLIALTILIYAVLTFGLLEADRRQKTPHRATART